MISLAHELFMSEHYPLKKFFFIPSIDRVCGSDGQEKKSDFLHGSVRRYKTEK